MRFLMVLCLLLMGASAFAEEEAMRDVKTANPFILLHPESQQAAAGPQVRLKEKQCAEKVSSSKQKKCE